jgi:two-component sensor histidine kinase
MAEAATGRVDANGRLIAADPLFLRFQEAAGSAMGSELAVPALVRLAGLARSLQVSVARQLVVADARGTFDAAASAHCEAGDVIITMTDLELRGPRDAWRETLDDEDTPIKSVASGPWTWSVDEQLHLTSGPDAIQPSVGLSFDTVFRLLEGEGGIMPLLMGLATRRSFSGQPAMLRDNPSVEYLLSGTPIFSDTDNFMGFSGMAVPADALAPSVEALPFDTQFSVRLDGALRAPLGRITAEADLIRAQNEGPLRYDYADYAGDIASAARHLLGLIDDLGDLEAIERPDYRPDIETIDLADIVRRAAGLLQVRAIDSGVKIDRPDFDEVLPARGEFRRVLQIMVNLIGNAVRYSPQGGMVWLRTEIDEDSAVVIVADLGKGISIDNQERIFEKFERVDPSEPGGTGLGLYIARRLARSMGGDIVVDSAPGQGARFVLTLPRAAN